MRLRLDATRTETVTEADHSARKPDADLAGISGSAPDAAGTGKAGSGKTGTSPQRDDYAAELGRRLRAARHRRGMSLVDVQERTNGRWTAGTLGAYERGRRSLRVHRLMELAELYDVTAVVLIPSQTDRSELAGLPPLAIDLQRLRKLPPTRTGPLRRWIAIVQVLRSESSRDVLRLRRTDLLSLARLYSTTPPLLYERLRAWGTLVEPGSGQRPALPRGRRGQPRS
ncbi:helix-turn-helix domain protein [Candidatus Protofrankia datiscae]|uniref:Helix-turn-helix domain protein n=1 Tax=Candidatus Protofrankia datiscae TaxID=2716812 RepID=F8B5J2_9ACTN|nr:helix-turn-helix domain protein [Candidatus Protofrankia datiscae]